MSQNLGANDWTTARGDKWSAQLHGMEATLKPVDAPLIAALQLNAPATIAEVGCGGGDTTIELLRRAPAGSVIHGFDISPKLIDIARAKADSQGATFNVADMALAAPLEPYDRLVSRFGIMFFDDPQAAFNNLARWLKPGGRFAFAAWGPTSDNMWITIVRDVVSQVVDLPKSDPDAPGPFRYGDATKLTSLLDRAGFTDIDVIDWRGTLAVGGGLPADEAAHFALSAFSSFAEDLARAGDAATLKAKQLLTERFAQHQRAGIVQLSSRVHLFTGTRR